MAREKISRRHFIVGSALLAAGCSTSALPRRRGRTRRVSPNERLNVAGIGAGGKGWGDILHCADAGENIVAICDVDWERAAPMFDKFPEAKRYRDFRVMLEKEKDIDAVTISTPDHMHYPAALTAMSLGKHVYVQKPLTHTVWEARQLTAAAEKYKVATQMGNQGHSGDGVRELCEMIWSGAIGPVRECHVWTNRPIWPQAIGRPPGSDPVPDYLDWDLWLGVAPWRPYVKAHPDTDRPEFSASYRGLCYLPKVWRGWWDFGCGALGDMGCHAMDPANWALKLCPPTSVETVMQEGLNEETGPTQSVLRYAFPARGDMPALSLYWYDGGARPAVPEGVPEDQVSGSNGCLFLGDDGQVLCGTYGDHPRLVPFELMEDYTPPTPYLPRIDLGDDRHSRDWLRACKGGPPACSNFAYAGPLSEIVLLGNVALRAGQRIDWDSEKMRITNMPEANAFISKAYRRGWV